MFTRVERPAQSEAELFAHLHPELSSWFRGRFGHFAPAQAVAVPEILAGNSLLLSSPTGSGKTLAAFLAVFDFLAKTRDRRELPNGIVAVYASPLRALAYDLRKNLQQPLDELGWDWLRVGARTGDTTTKERAQQKRRPPHILVTTPESLTLLLSQPGWLAPFRETRFFIADELHALAENKRGAMLMVAAERLEETRGLVTSEEWQGTSTEPPRAQTEQSTESPVSSTPPSEAVRNHKWQPTAASPTGSREQSTGNISSSSSLLTTHSSLIRIGLSATVSPLETVAEFLVGPHRDCRIAEVTQRKPARIEVFSPLRDRAYPPAGYTASRVLMELGTLLGQRRTTLIFSNTRSGAEHIGLRLKQLMP